MPNPAKEPCLARRMYRLHRKLHHGLRLINNTDIDLDKLIQVFVVSALEVIDGLGHELVILRILPVTVLWIKPTEHVPPHRSSSGRS